MATEKLEIVVGADVQEVVQKLEQLEKVAKTTMQKTATSFEPVKTALESVQVEAFDTDKAFREAMDRVTGTVDKKISEAITSFHQLDNAIEKDVASSVQAIRTLEDKFQHFGGVTNKYAGNAAKHIGVLDASLRQLPKGSSQATQGIINFSRVVQDAPFGIIGVANNIDPLIASFTALKASTGSAGAAFKALAGSLIGPAGIALAVSAVTSALVFYAQGQQKANKETKEAKKDTDGYVQNLTKQKVELEALANIARNSALAEEDRVRALKRLNEIIPDSIGLLNKQNISTAEGINILRQYVKAIEARATAELLVNRIAENNIQLFDNRNKQLQTAAEFESRLADLRSRAARFEAAGKLEIAADLTKQILALQKEYNKALAEGRTFSQNILLDNQKIREEYERILPPVIELEDKTGKIKDKTVEYKAAVDGILSAYQANNVALQEQLRLQTLLLDLQRKSNELRKGGQQPTQPLGLTNEQQLNLAGDDSQAGAALENIEAIKKKLIDVSDVLNNGINAGIDQFFNAIANNQDPFEALAQSAKRLVAELAAAVVKALLLQAISNAIAPGSGGLLSGLTGSGGSVIRGDQLRLLTFLRG